MPRYKMVRDVSGWSDGDLNAGRIRAQFCALWFDGMRWLTSYYDPAAEELTCIFDAEREDDLRAHALAADLPVPFAICEVIQILPAEEEEAPADGSMDRFDRAGFLEADRDIRVTAE
jgi:hypothetical protein